METILIFIVFIIIMVFIVIYAKKRKERIKKFKFVTRKTIFNVHHIYSGISHEQLQKVVDQCTSGDEICLHGEFKAGEIVITNLPNGLTITGDRKKENKK